MKTVLISAEEITKKDLLKTFEEIDSSKIKYIMKTIPEPTKKSLELKGDSLYNLIILPLDWGKLEQGINYESQEELLKLEGVKWAYDLKKQGYLGKLILTLDHEYKTELEEAIKNLCELGRIQFSFEKKVIKAPFVNLYSLIHAPSVKQSKLLNSLEGVPLHGVVPRKRE